MSITDVYDYPYEDGDNQPRIVRIRVHQREEKKELEMKIVGAVKHHDPSGAVRYQDDPSIGSFKSMDRLSQEDLLAIGRAIEFYNSGNVPEE